MLRGLSVALGSPTSKFSGAIDPASRKITVSGTVREDKPFLNRIGAFDVDLALEACDLNPNLKSNSPLNPHHCPDCSRPCSTYVQG